MAPYRRSRIFFQNGDFSFQKCANMCGLFFNSFIYFVDLFSLAKQLFLIRNTLALNTFIITGKQLKQMVFLKAAALFQRMF